MLFFFTLLDLPPPDPAAIGRRRLLIFSLDKLSLSPGMAHFSSINVRIEVSDITHRIVLYWFLNFKTVVVIMQTNEIFNFLKHFILTIWTLFTQYSLIAKVSIYSYNVCKSVPPPIGYLTQIIVMMFLLTQCLLCFNGLITNSQN